MSILERDNWTDKSIDFMISDIMEYDMKRGGLSIIKTDNLLPSHIIDRLESKEKRAADKEIGVMQKTDKNLKEGLLNGFRKYRLEFGALNELQDEDIISVKKDAIFTKKYCPYTRVRDNIIFVEKNHYEAFLRLNGCEFYWGPDHKLDVKGIHDNQIRLHEKYMLDFIWNFLRYLCNYDADGARKYIVHFIDEYKCKQLPIEYYREFNTKSIYTYIMYDNITEATYLDPAYKHLVIGNYNFINIIVPLLNYVI